MPMTKLVSALGFTGFATLSLSEVAQFLAAFYSFLLICQLVFNWCLRALVAYRVRIEEKQILLEASLASIEQDKKEDGFTFLRAKVQKDRVHNEFR